MFTTERLVVRSGYSFIPLSLDLSPAASSQVNAGRTRCFLTERSHWGPCRASWWLRTPACVRPSMQSGRCGRSSEQTCTGHSGADWPGAGNSCGTPGWPNWEGITQTEQGNITAAPQTSCSNVSKECRWDFKDRQLKTMKRQKDLQSVQLPLSKTLISAVHPTLWISQSDGNHRYACD